MPHWQSGYFSVPLGWHFSQKNLELVTNYLGIFLTINVSLILMYTNDTFPYVIETINLATLPPVPSFLAFAVQCIDKPSFFFLQVRVHADFACAHGLLFCTKLTPSIYKTISSFQNESGSFFLLIVFANCNLTLQFSAVSCPFFLH